MARTKASVGAKVSSGKSSKARCSVAPPSSSGGSSGSTDKSSRSHSGGNPVCPRETPKWQRPITNFFVSKDVHVDENESDDDRAAAGSSKSKPKRNVIQSDDEDSETVDQTTENGEAKPITENEEDKETTTENGEDEQTTTKNGEVKQKTTENEEVEQSENNSVDINLEQRPTNHVLDETLELEPLNGEDCRKIDEFYTKNPKGKGIGKKTKGKENLDVNGERRSSLKRDLESDSVDDVQPSKKVKVSS